MPNITEISIADNAIWYIMMQKGIGAKAVNGAADIRVVCR
jgi:hypothetical protein